MPFETSKTSRERILAMGPAGTGKTHSWLSVARMSQKRGSDAVFYALDTDNSVERMLDEDFAELQNVIVLPTYEWPEYMDNVNETRAKVKNNDWAIVDMLSPAWDAVQEHYVDRAFNKGVDEFFLESRKAGDKQAFEGWRDWGVINKMYRSFTNSLLRMPCHLFCTAAVDGVTTQGPMADEKSTRMLFGPHGVKPRGQKHTAHLFHTILLMSNREVSRKPEWTFTSVKDRGREMVSAQKTTDFSLNYLVKIAKWRMGSAASQPPLSGPDE